MLYHTQNNSKIKYQNRREIIDATNTQIHDRKLSWLGTGISITKSGGVKLYSYINN
jgi:hypothetical protein